MYLYKEGMPVWHYLQIAISEGIFCREIDLFLYKFHEISWNFCEVQE